MPNKIQGIDGKINSELTFGVIRVPILTLRDSILMTSE